LLFQNGNESNKGDVAKWDLNTVPFTIHGAHPGKNNGITKKPVTLVVNPAPKPDFNISASPGTLTVQRGPRAITL
jgi:hypothetical protein